MPDGGGYPKGFLQYAFRTLGVRDPDAVLHLCSGSVRTGITVDVRWEMQPAVVADCRQTPFRDESFDFILADPPYGETYAETQYGTGNRYPRPGSILKEAERLLRVGGRFGILHFLVPIATARMKGITVYGITTGGGYAIRAWTVFEKIPIRDSLFQKVLDSRGVNC